MKIARLLSVALLGLSLAGCTSNTTSLAEPPSYKARSYGGRALAAPTFGMKDAACPEAPNVAVKEPSIGYSGAARLMLGKDKNVYFIIERGHGFSGEPGTRDKEAFHKVGTWTSAEALKADAAVAVNLEPGFGWQKISSGTGGSCIIQFTLPKLPAATDNPAIEAL